MQRTNPLEEAVARLKPVYTALIGSAQPRDTTSDVHEVRGWGSTPDKQK